MAYDKDMSGSFSANKKKEQPNHADVKGSIKVEGVDYWLSAWKKETNGETWYSVSLQKKEARSGGSQGESKSANKPASSGSIPF